MPARSTGGHRRLQVLGDGLPSALPAILDGRLKAIAVMAEQRVRLLPEVPTFVELGMGEVGKSACFGLIAPAGTPEVSSWSSADGIA